MKTVGVFIAFLIFTIQLISQTQVVLSPTNLDSLVSFEKSIGSISKGFQYFNPYHDENFEDIYAYWPNVLKKPLIFKRTNDEFYPTLHSWYFYDQDSIVKWIKYHWGFGNTTVEASDDEIRKQTFREKDFKKKYQLEKEKLKELLGSPTIENEEEETDSYLNMKTIWDLPEKRVIIEMTIDKKVVEFEPKEVEKTIVIPRSKIEIKILLKQK